MPVGFRTVYSLKSFSCEFEGQFSLKFERCGNMLIICWLFTSEYMSLCGGETLDSSLTLMIYEDNLSIIDLFLLFD